MIATSIVLSLAVFLVSQLVQKRIKTPVKLAPSACMASITCVMMIDESVRLGLLRPDDFYTNILLPIYALAFVFAGMITVGGIESLERDRYIIMETGQRRVRKLRQLTDSRTMLAYAEYIAFVVVPSLLTFREHRSDLNSIRRINSGIDHALAELWKYDKQTDEKVAQEICERVVRDANILLKSLGESVTIDDPDLKNVDWTTHDQLAGGLNTGRDKIKIRDARPVAPLLRK